jgi:hypothetical protein
LDCFRFSDIRHLTSDVWQRFVSFCKIRRRLHVPDRFRNPNQKTIGKSANVKKALVTALVAAGFFAQSASASITVSASPGGPTSVSPGATWTEQILYTSTNPPPDLGAFDMLFEGAATQNGNSISGFRVTGITPNPGRPDWVPNTTNATNDFFGAHTVSDHSGFLQTIDEGFSSTLAPSAYPGGPFANFSSEHGPSKCRRMLTREPTRSKQRSWQRALTTTATPHHHQTAPTLVTGPGAIPPSSQSRLCPNRRLGLFLAWERSALRVLTSFARGEREFKQKVTNTTKILF